MVLDSFPITSLMRWAARPVGAASSTVRPMASRSLTSTRVMVVFPHPGPPVKIENRRATIPVTAVSCSSLRWRRVRVQYWVIQRLIRSVSGCSAPSMAVIFWATYPSS